MTACSNITTETDTAAQEEYNQDSWQTIISESCVSFYDGCNTCNRAADSELVACTRKFCAEYEKPRCTDAEATVNTGS